MPDPLFTIDELSNADFGACGESLRGTPGAQPAEAEKAARRRVSLDGISPRARYLLAVTLLAQGKMTPEVEKDLRQATEEFPRAYLLPGQVLIAKGQLA